MNRNTKVYTRGVDPIVIKLREEQLRQDLSDYALAAVLTRDTKKIVDPATLGKLWKGKANPNLKRLRSILTALRRPKSEGGNPDFVLRDP